MNESKFSMNKLFWGLVFIAGAIILVLGKLDIFSPELSLGRILFSILFAALCVHGISKVNFFEILFSLAFLACLYDEWLHITALTPWTVLGAALLGSIGLSILFPKKRPWHVHHGSKATQETVCSEEDTIHLENSFGASIKYINSEHFLNAHLESSFGEMKVYYDNAIPSQPTIYSTVDVSFGCMILYVPQTWQIRNSISCCFGVVEIKNAANAVPDDGPVLELTGEVAFGDLQIYYV